MSDEIKPIHMRSNANKSQRDPNGWYYEEPEGLCIVANSGSLNPGTWWIPRRQVEAYLRRLQEREEA